jgi:hypothetical protein
MEHAIWYLWYLCHIRAIEAWRVALAILRSRDPLFIPKGR